MNKDSGTASTSQKPPSLLQNSVEAWSPPPSPWPSNVAPMISTQSNSMKQFQGFGQTAAWGTEPVPDSYLDDDWFQPDIELFDAATASAPPQFSVDTGRPQQVTWPSNGAPTTSTPSNPMEQFQHYRQMATWGTVPVPDSHLDDDWFQPENDFFDAATASALPCSSVNAAYLQPSSSSSHVAPPTSTQYNPEEQIQNQTAAWNIDSAPVTSHMADTSFPRLQPSGSHMNPQEVDSSDTIYATTSAPPQSRINAWSPRQPTWPSNVAPPTSTQYNPIDQIQNPGPTPVWSVNSASAAPDMVNTPLPRLQPSDSHMNPQEVVPPESRYATASAPPQSRRSASATKAPFMVAGPSRGMQPFSSYVNPQEVIPSDASHVAKKRGRGSDKVNSNKRNSSDERVMSILSKYAEKTSTTGTLDETTRSILWKHFYQNPYPSTAEKNKLAKQLRLKPTQVTNRFNHRRTTKSKKSQQIDNDPDAVDHHDTESTSTEDSENIDPDWEPM